MRSDSQPDLIRHSDANLAEAHKIAAEMALINPHEPMKYREQRHARMLAEAERYERLAAQRIPA